MKADKTSEEYESLRRELPDAYQENWLPLLGSCALFVIALWTGRRGKEGLLTLKKTAFAKVYDDDTETWAYEKVVGELSKNNQDTDENLENGGCISFETMKESGKKRQDFDCKLIMLHLRLCSKTNNFSLIFKKNVRLMTCRELKISEF